MLLGGALLVLCASTVLAVPSPQKGTIVERKVKVSSDGSCGGSKGFTCKGSSFGNCCSSYGWCGSDSNYCGKGCQTAFGTCTSSTTTTTTTTTPQSSKTTTTTAQPTVKKNAGNPSPDGSCGGSTGYTCAGTTFGSCCSQYGWCGSTSDHCNTGCQSGFGSCSGSGTTTTTNPSSPVSPSPSPSATSTQFASLTDCLDQKGVPLKLASDSDWNTYEATYNTRLQYIPAAISLPTTSQHISDSVICAGIFGVKVQAKSGGHSYASFSTGGSNGALVVDLENLQNVSVDSKGIATVGAGLRLGNLASQIYNQAQRALPHGTCPGVGIGGHFTHGGFGYSSRAWGLALDTIVGMDVVLADGSYVHATTKDYPDVFWALRGAADSFGIVVNFYLQTNPAPASVVNWSFGFQNMFTNVQTISAAFSHIQNFVQNASVVDRNTGMGMYMDGDGFSVSGTYFGSIDTFNNKIAPELLRTLPQPSSSSVQSMSWIDSLTALGGIGTLSEPVHGYSAHDNFFAKSVTVPEPLTPTAVTSYFQYIVNKGVNPPTPWFSIINLYGGPDSQINNKDITFAAYSDRSSLWVAQHYAYAGVGTAFPSAGLDFVAGLNNAMTSQMPSTNFGAYLNYVDPSLTAQQAHTLYYGDALYSKLKTLKTQLDPGNIFANPQSI